MVTIPSQARFFGWCLLSAVAALFLVVSLDANAWLLFPVAILVLSVGTFLDGYWRGRS